MKLGTPIPMPTPSCIASESLSLFEFSSEASEDVEGEVIGAVVDSVIDVDDGI